MLIYTCKRCHSDVESLESPCFCGAQDYEEREVPIKVLGSCLNCYADIIEGDHMDCCGNRELVEF